MLIRIEDTPRGPIVTVQGTNGESATSVAKAYKESKEELRKEDKE